MKFGLLNNSYKVGIITLLTSLLGFLATIFLFFMGYKDIPLGIILGGCVIGGLNLLSGFLETIDQKNKTIKFSIMMVIIRFVVIVSLSVVLALMYYRWEIKLFNIFAFVGVYTVSAIITGIVYFKERRGECK